MYSEERWLHLGMKGVRELKFLLQKIVSCGLSQFWMTLQFLAEEKHLSAESELGGMARMALARLAN
jgi:hypothetical protein